MQVFADLIGGKHVEAGPGLKGKWTENLPVGSGMGEVHSSLINGTTRLFSHKSI